MVVLEQPVEAAAREVERALLAGAAEALERHDWAAVEDLLAARPLDEPRRPWWPLVAVAARLGRVIDEADRPPTLDQLAWELGRDARRGLARAREAGFLACAFARGTCRALTLGLSAPELAVVGCTLLILGAAFLPSMGCTGCGPSRNASVAANVNTTRMAVEQHAADHRGRPPATASWHADLLQRNYLPGNRSPKSPWGPSLQANSLAVDDLRKLGVKLPAPVGTVIGPGKVPTSPVYDVQTYGAIAYERTPDGYTLVGVGKKNGDAILAGSTFN